MKFDPQRLGVSLSVVTLVAACSVAAPDGTHALDTPDGGSSSTDSGTGEDTDAATSPGRDGGSTSDAGYAMGTDGGDDVPPAPAQGASVPYWEYEAEDPAAATTNGTVLPVSTTFGDVAAEASGRSAVKLQGAGQNVSFTLAHRANSIVVRYSIPDAPSGGGAKSAIGLYVNGVRQDLALTSRYSWTYGDADAHGSGSESPSSGTPHHFFDEAHALFAEVPAGATIKLQVDAQDSAASYVVNLVDFEEVAAPLTRPAGSLSIADFGATPDDGSDDSAAITVAIAAASSQGKVLWIPKGVFDQPSNPGGLSWSTTPKLRVAGITIRGAGMWYSVLNGFGAQFEVSGNDNQFYDFAVFGDVTYRDDTEGWQGFDGPAGTGSRMENVWIEHETVGWWLGKGQFVGPVDSPLTQGLVIHGVRVRDTYADGINFADGTSGSTIEQSTFRNTGDDSIATWSYAADGTAPCQNDVFQFNTVQTVWRASCFALYGGSDNRLVSSTCADTSNYSGVFLATTGGFDVIPFGGTTTVEHMTLTRAGGWHASYDYNGMGALKLFADGKPISGDLQISDLVLDAPVLTGIQFSGSQPISGVTIRGVKVESYGTAGIAVDSGSNGSAELDDVAVSGSVNVGVKNDSPNSFTLNRGSGDTGW